MRPLDFGELDPEWLIDSSTVIPLPIVDAIAVESAIAIAGEGLGGVDEAPVVGSGVGVDGGGVVIGVGSGLSRAEASNVSALPKDETTRKP